MACMHVWDHCPGVKECSTRYQADKANEVVVPIDANDSSFVSLVSNAAQGWTYTAQGVSDMLGMQYYSGGGDQWRQGARDWRGFPRSVLSFAYRRQSGAYHRPSRAELVSAVREYVQEQGLARKKLRAIPSTKCKV